VKVIDIRLKKNQFDISPSHVLIGSMGFIQKLKERVKVKRLLVLFIFCYIGLVIFGWFAADKMIFVPSEKYGPLSGEVTLNSEQEKLTAVWLENPKAQHVILFSHGNAENLEQNMFYFKLMRREGFSVFAYDYRGYGRSTGKPTEQGTYRDIEAAYRYLTKTLKIDPKRIIIHGRSVGTGPSTWLASKHPVGGLILESPFTSSFRVVIPVIPVIGDKFPNLRRIRKVSCPLLVIHGEVDDAIPIAHGRKVFARHPGPKMSYWVPRAGHNDILQWSGEAYWNTMHKFEKLVDESQSRPR